MTQCAKEDCQERDQCKKSLDQMRFQHEVLAEIHELTDPRSRTPLQDMQMIRIKAAVALRAAAQSGMLS